MVDPDAISAARRALGQQLAAYRKAADFTQEQFAAHLVYSRSAVGNVETGRQNVPRDFWQRADAALGTNGVLLAGYNDLQRLVDQHRAAVVTALEVQRQTKIRERHEAAAALPPTTSASQISSSVGLVARGLGAPDGAALAFTQDADNALSGTGLWEPQRTVEDIDRFTLGDMMLGRREATKVLASLLVGSALTEPLEHWVGAVADDPMPKRRRLGDHEVSHIEAATRALRHWDNRFRLGIRRRAVVGQLSEVTELLREGQSPEITQRLFAVVAELAKIAASMSYDAGLHPTAQRYYLFALRATHQIGDRLQGAEILADMARQLLDLKHPGDALELVRLAIDGTQTESQGRVLAMLRTREAWAYAELTRVQAFHRAVGQAKESFAEPDSRPLPSWAVSFDEAELAGVIGARYRDLARQDPAQAPRAVEHIQQALALRHPRKIRNRAFDTIGLGRAYLVMNEPEEACRVTRSAIAMAERIGSGRVNKRLADFYAESAPYTKNRAVNDFRGELHHRLNLSTAKKRNR